MEIIHAVRLSSLGKKIKNAADMSGTEGRAMSEKRREGDDVGKDGWVG